MGADYSPEKSGGSLLEGDDNIKTICLTFGRNLTCTLFVIKDFFFSKTNCETNKIEKGVGFIIERNFQSVSDSNSVTRRHFIV